MKDLFDYLILVILRFWYKVYLIIIDLRKEIGTDQYIMMLIENWLSP